MKYPCHRRNAVFLTVIFLSGSLSARAAPLGTAFTYQGRLNNAGSPASGLHDLRFSLYDASEVGAAVGAAVCANDVSVTDGLFTVPLDFGAQFAGQQRFLEIEVRADTGLDCGDGTGFTTLAPRQELSGAPHALFALNADVLDGLDSSAFLQSIAVPLTLTGTSATHIIRGENASTATLATGVYGLASAGSGFTSGGRFESNSTSGLGVQGVAAANVGATTGVSGTVVSASGTGVYGSAIASTGTTYGVHGQNQSVDGRGVYGSAIASTGTTSGVYGRSSSTSGRGVYGESSAGSGVTYGGRFESASPSGRGVYGLATNSSGNTYGVHGRSSGDNGIGVVGQAVHTTGVTYGVYGVSDSPSGFDFFAAGGASVAYGGTSSRRWKSNIEPIGQPLNKLGRLRGVYFNWDAEHGGQHDVGMIAEEVGAVLPEIVGYEENGVDAIGMDYSKMTPLLVEAVNALRAEKDAEIAELRARIESLEKTIRQLPAPKEGARQ